MHEAVPLKLMSDCIKWQLLCLQVQTMQWQMPSARPAIFP